MGRLPATIYPTLSPNVPCWQVTGDGRVSASISTATSTASLELDINGNNPLDVIQWENDLIGTSQKGGAADGLGDIWVVDPGAYSPATTGSIFDNAGVGAAVLRRTIALATNLTGLRRTVPARHPIRPYLNCSNISGVQGLANTGQKTDKKVQALWKILRYTVDFETLPFKIKTDDQVSNEWERWVSTPGDPVANEYLKRQDGAYQYPDLAGMGNKTIPREVAQVMCKKKVRMTWHRLPDDGLFNNGGRFNGGKAVQLDSGLGRVNRYRWFGYNPGTLLFDSWTPVLRSMPCEPLMNAVNLNQTGPFIPSWDVELEFTYFEPPPALAGTYPNVTYVPNSDELQLAGPGSYEELVFGWNCFPRPDGTNRWYRIFVRGMPDREPFWRYQTYDFNDLFRIWR